MSEQLLFPEIPRPPGRNDCLFLAIFPDIATAARIARLTQRLRVTHRLQGKPLATSRLHVSLYHLGNYCGVPAGIVSAASAAAAAVAAVTPPFAITFDRAVSFSGKPGNRPFVLKQSGGPDAALATFHRNLGEALGRHGLPFDGTEKFTPHLTLLYDAQGVTEQSIDPVGWTATEFVLVHSLLGKTRHIPLARWRFATG
jgi:2'-5' RNA ligase